MKPFNWTCPHCSRPQVVTEDNFQEVTSILDVTPLKLGDVGIGIVAIACLNADCKQLSLTASLKKWQNRQQGFKVLSENIRDWRLMPESSAVPQPDYIPKPLLDDYYEACRIRDLSPKASATLARRCLQGMIRDFCGIAKGTLDAEIKALKVVVEGGKAPPGVTAESVEAIDHVRSVGNIGAHMEKDINLIVEVDAGEAQALIGLVEMLFDEWYVARHNRQQKLAKISAIASEKKTQIAATRPPRADAEKKRRRPATKQTSSSEE